MEASEVEKGTDGVCHDCGAVVAEGRVGCQRLFEEALVLDYSDYRYAKAHRLLVDAYSLQHPDTYMRSGKSFAAHLTGMRAALEHEDQQAINQAAQQWLNGAQRIDKPARLPEQRGDLTITHIRGALDAEDHNRRVREWARSVWEAWAEYHELARQWISEATQDQSSVRR